VAVNVIVPFTGIGSVGALSMLTSVVRTSSTATVQVAARLLPSVVVAVIVAVPADTAVTRPL
jgi:hypothetical protein